MREVMVSVRVAPVDCWNCGAEFGIVPSLELSQGDRKVECCVADFTAFPGLVAAVEANLPPELEVGPLKSRLSRALQASYVSNGCFHCDALFGQHYEIHARYDEKVVAVFLGVPANEWGNMIAALEQSEDGHLF